MSSEQPDRQNGSLRPGDVPWATTVVDKAQSRQATEAGEATYNGSER